jgi:hypothetical protein
MADKLDGSWPLAEPLTLKSGVRLTTLHDAAEALLRHFGNVNHDAPIAHAIDLMMRAAETGTRGDRAAVGPT